VEPIAPPQEPLVLALAQAHHAVYAQTLEEALDADAKRVGYRGRVTSPGGGMRGYDSSLTPLHSTFDDF
jgi:hypothetical protein